MAIMTMQRTNERHEDARRLTTPGVLHVALFILALLAVLVLLANSSSLWDRDEPRFARCAVEMVERGAYLVPTFNAGLRPDKPAGIYWLMAAGVKMIGPTELAFRLWSILGMTGTALLTFGIGRMLFSRRTAWWAMAMTCGAILPFWIGTAATSDGAMLLTITTCHFVYVHRFRHGPQWWHWPLVAVALSIGQLIKGPVALAIPLLTLLGMTIALRRRRVVTWSWWVGAAIASLVGIGVFLAWALPANEASGGELARQGLGHHVFTRMRQPMENHGGSGVVGYIAALPLHVPYLIFGFFPWTLFLPGAIHALLRRRLCDDDTRALLLGWILPTFILMSLIATKLPHYILPIYPALALLAAESVAAFRRGTLHDWDRRWLRGGVWFFVPVALAAAAGLGALPWIVEQPGHGWMLVPLALLLAGTCAWITVLHLREAFERSRRMTLLSVAVGVPTASLLVMPVIERTLKLSPDLAAAIREAAPGEPIATAGYGEPSLIFYLSLPPDERVEAIGEQPQAVAAWCAMDGPGVLVTTLAILEDADVDPTRLEEFAAHHVINYSSHGARADVVVVRRQSR